MADVITRLKVESSEYDSKIKRATQSLNEMTTAAEREGNKIATANKENIALAQSLGKMATVSTTARGKMSELSAAIESATIQYNRLTQAEKQGQFGKALNTSITQLQGRLNTIRTEMAAVQGQMGKVGAIGGGMGIGAQFGSGLKSAAMMFGPAALAIGGVTAAIGGLKKVMGDMVSINMQFEQGTAVLASIMGKTTDEISALTDQAKQLGATTRYTAMQITELQTNLARLGFSEQEILNSTKAVQAFATATGADLGEAANLAGAALRGFGMNATEMERAASVMAVSTTKSALSFEKLATAVPIVAPVAKQFGFTIEDTVTLLGKLSDAGMDASTAATATRNIFLKMADSGGKLSQAMGRPVHSVEEFGEALKEMREKGMSLNDILKMVGVRSTAAFAVFADNADTLKDFKQSITDCSEAMHDMEDKQINTLQGSVTILNSAWEGLMLTFSESNGVIKTVVDSLTELLGAWTKWRKRNQGGDSAIQTYELGGDADKAQSYIEKQREAGVKDEGIKAQAEADKEALTAEIEELKKLEALYGEYDKWVSKADWHNPTHLKKNDEYLDTFKAAGYGGGKESRTQLQKDIAAKIDQTSTLDLVIGQMTPAQIKDAASTGAEGGGKDNSKSRLALLKAQYEEQEKAQIAALDRMAVNEADYEAEVYKIKRETLQKIADLYQEETAEKARANAAISQLDIQYQGTQMRLANKANKGSGKDPELTALEKRNKRIQELTSSIAEMNNILATSTDANEKAWATNQLQAYNSELDRLNGKLKETATNITELPTKFELMRESLDKMSTGVGAISTLGNAFNDLKGIGEDLASAFSGEMDAWDSLMTVFNSGISIMQTVIGVMEAINTLQELAGTLSDVRIAKQQAETTAVVTGKTEEATANLTEAGTSMASAGANAAEGATAAGKSVAWIPIVGPILAAAAIAGTIAAMIAAMSKAKSAGNFAEGGIIGGNSYSGDRLTANVNSGELIMSVAQQNNVANALQAGQQRGGTSTSYISGENIVLGVNNFLGRSGRGELVTTSMLRRAGINL